MEKVGRSLRIDVCLIPIGINSAISTFPTCQTLIHWIEKLNRFEPPGQSLEWTFGSAWLTRTTDRGEVGRRSLCQWI